MCLPVQNFERDQVGQEMGPAARVWPEYVEAATEFDNRTVEGWNASIDVILIFAALFSGVLTAFLIESYALLSPDPGNATLSVLQEISGTLKGVATGTPFAETAPTPSTSTEFSPSAIALWVNGLWFTSLTCSLGVGSVAMLLKQWLHAYGSNLTGPLQIQARLRQRRYAALLAWRTPTLIASLPLLLSIALMEFLAGLAAFLFSINTLIGSLVSVAIALTLIIHAASLVLPAFTDCPYKTAASSAMYRILYPGRVLLRTIVGNRRVLGPKRILVPIISAVGKCIKAFWYSLLWVVNLAYPFGRSVFRMAIVHPLRAQQNHVADMIRAHIWPTWNRIFYSSRYYYWVTPPYLLWLSQIRIPATRARTVWDAILQWTTCPTESQSEIHAIESEGSALDAHAILWLMESKREHAKETAVKAVAGLSRNKVAARILREGGALDTLRGALQSCLNAQDIVKPEDAELYARGILNISSTQFLSTDSDYSSRDADAALVRPLSKSDIREVAATGMAAGLMVREMVELLEQHIDGEEIMSPFHLTIILDTLNYIFASRSRWKDDFWSTSKHGWEGWGQRIVPKLITLLNTGQEDVKMGPSPWATAVTVMLAVFTCGYSLEDVQALDDEEIRRDTFHRLVFLTLSPILKYPLKFQFTNEITEDICSIFLRSACTLMADVSSSIDRKFSNLDEETVVLPCLMQILSASQVERTLAQALLVLSKTPGNMFPRGASKTFAICLSRLKLSSDVLYNLLSCLENLSACNEHVIDFVIHDLSSQLVNLFDSVTEYRIEIFRILKSVLLASIGHKLSSRGQYLDKLISENVLGVVYSFFSSPCILLSIQDADDWVHIMSALCRHYQSVVVASGALVAIADAIEWHWRAAVLFKEHQETIDGLLRQIGLGTRRKQPVKYILDVQPKIPHMELRPPTLS